METPGEEEEKDVPLEEDEKEEGEDVEEDPGLRRGLTTNQKRASTNIAGLITNQKRASANIFGLSMSGLPYP